MLENLVLQVLLVLIFRDAVNVALSLIFVKK